MVTLQVLFNPYQVAFLQKYPDMQKVLTAAAEALAQACADVKRKQNAHSGIVSPAKQARQAKNIIALIFRDSQIRSTKRDVSFSTW